MAALLSGREEGPEPVLLAMPADHLVADTGAFHDAVRKAHGLAAAGRIVTFGIVPTSGEDEIVRFDDRYGRAAG